MNKKQIHSNVLALPNKHKFSVKNVLEWIKTQQVVAKQCRNGAKRFTGAKSLQSRGKAFNAEAYVKLMRKYNGAPVSVSRPPIPDPRSKKKDK